MITTSSNVNVTKNRKPLIVPLNQTMINILKEHLKFRQNETKDDFLFCNSYGQKLVKSTCYHSTRRLLPSLFRNATVSLRLGHARGKTTLSCFLTLSRRFSTSRRKAIYIVRLRVASTDCIASKLILNELAHRK